MSLEKSIAVPVAVRNPAAPTILHDGYHWHILACGITKEPKTLLHLASTSQGTHTENGWYPRQTTDWIDTAKLREAGVLNVALKAEKVSVNTWSMVEAFKKVDGAGSLFLTRDQVQRLLDATDGEIHNLIRAGVLTGSRL